MLRIATTLIFILAASLSAQYVLMAPVSLADITGDAAAHQIASSGTARAITICALAANTAVVRLGNSSITTSKGFPVAAGGCAGYLEVNGGGDAGGQIRPARWDLSSIYYLAATGDKVSISYIP
jgi:hypothetical protein